MSELIPWINRGLVPASKAAIGPYGEFQDALRAYHIGLGLTAESLQAQHDQVRVLNNFVIDAVQLLPSAQVTSLEMPKISKFGQVVKIARDLRNIKDVDSNFTLGYSRPSFETTDSMRAETIMNAVVWNNGVPQYVIGHSKDGLAVITPKFEPASDTRLRSSEEVTNVAWYVPTRTAVHVASTVLRASTGLLDEVGPTKVYYNDPYGQNDGFVVANDVTFVAKRGINHNRLTHFSTGFMQLADVEEKVQSGSRDTDGQLERSYDPKTKAFIVGRDVLDGFDRVVDVTSGPDAPQSWMTEGVSPDVFMKYHIMERLVILGLRFDVIDPLTDLVDRLHDESSAIRGAVITSCDTAKGNVGDAITADVIKKVEERTDTSAVSHWDRFIDRFGLW